MQGIPLLGLIEGGFASPEAAVVRIGRYSTTNLIGVLRYPEGDPFGDGNREYGIVLSVPGEQYGDYMAIDVKDGRVVSLDFGFFWLFVGSADSQCWVLPPDEVPSWAARMSSGAAPVCTS